MHRGRYPPALRCAGSGSTLLRVARNKASRRTAITQPVRFLVPAGIGQPLRTAIYGPAEKGGRVKVANREIGKSELPSEGGGVPPPCKGGHYEGHSLDHRSRRACIRPSGSGRDQRSRSHHLSRVRRG